MYSWNQNCLMPLCDCCSHCSMLLHPIGLGIFAGCFTCTSRSPVLLALQQLTDLLSQDNVDCYSEQQLAHSVPGLMTASTNFAAGLSPADLAPPCLRRSNCACIFVGALTCMHLKHPHITCVCSEFASKTSARLSDGKIRKAAHTRLWLLNPGLRALCAVLQSLSLVHDSSILFAHESGIVRLLVWAKSLAF